MKRLLKLGHEVFLVSSAPISDYILTYCALMGANNEKGMLCYLRYQYTVRNAHGNIDRSGEISNGQLCCFLQSTGKKFHEMHRYFTSDIM
jgi:hypothetical protein